jgi:hypothetical protein
MKGRRSSGPECDIPPDPAVFAPPSDPGADDFGGRLRLFDEGETPIPLRLISSETFKTGVLNVVYGPAEPTGDVTYEDAKVHLAQPEQ